jgi:TonB-linked SusC/RagA family outer membrane protein
MKLSYYVFIIQLVALKFMIVGLSYGQHALSVKETFVSLNLEETTLLGAFESLEQVSDFHFNYDKLDIRSDKKIDLKYQNSSVADILLNISKDYNLKFRQLNNTIQVDDKLNTNTSNKIIEVLLADVNISGIVLDENGEGLPGVNILIKGTTNGVLTDFGGNYQIEAPIGGTLVFSFIGYETVERAVDNQSVINIQMTLDAAELSEVVIVGYGSQNRANVTGAVSQLKAKNIKDMPVRGVDEAIAGQMAGVNVVQGTGSPGTSAAIQIRGVATVTAGTNPLLVVDGFPSENLNLSDVNPNDIESIEVLKDAASASIYGSRAGNGVILLTTNKGSDKGLSIDFNAYGGVQRVANTYDMANAYEWAEYQTETFINQGSWAADGSEIPTRYRPYLAGTPGLTDTDWQDEIFRNASIQSYQLSISGGNEQTKFYVSGNVFEQEGVILGSDFDRYSFRANIESNLLNNPQSRFIKNLDFGINLAPTYTVSNRVSEGHHNQDGIVITGLYLYPQFTPYDAGGSYNISEQVEFGLASPPDGLKSSGSPALFENPVAVALERENPVKRARLLSTTYLNLEIIEGLNFKTSFGFNYSNEQDRLYRPGFLGARASPAPTTATASSTTLNALNWINENTLTYSRSINKTHNIKVLAGYSFLTEKIEYTFLSGQGFANDDVATLNSASEIIGGSSNEEEWALKSYFGRINYDYEGKYLLTASVRTDGSSRFGANSEWGVFPAVSLGWRISEEDFFSGLGNTISDLKLRLSIGRTGNDQIPNYGAIARLGSANYNNGGSLSGGLTTISAPNANLSWEVTDQIDIGLDIGILNDKVFIVADYYKSTTDDMLLDVPVPSQSGYLTSLQNLGKVENTGFEFAVSGRDINLGPVKWSGSFNISTNQNELIELGPGQEEIITKFNKSELGRPLGEFYVYNIIGVYNTQEEIDASVHLSTAAPGDYIWEDVNGNGEIDANDRKVVGDAFPDFTYGISSSFEYKGIDLGVLIQGSKGAEIINFTNFFLTRRGDFANVTSDRVQGRWKSPSEPGTGWARSDAREWQYDQSNYLVEDASYLRVRNITLGYTFPSVLTNKAKIERARIYFSSQNPFTSTDYTGYNPEATSQIGSQGGPLEPGIDWGNYPIAKTFTMGVNLTF